MKPKTIPRIRAPIEEFNNKLFSALWSWKIEKNESFLMGE